MIGHPVAFSHDCIGADAEKIAADMKDGDVTLLLRTSAFTRRKRRMIRYLPPRWQNSATESTLTMLSARHTSCPCFDRRDYQVR